ncbi:hypothetical protein QCA50_009637 [Cerrena zonata]|uniref:Diaminohydroxyphosphoribosylamino-pyrimidine deaminase n=1 Tax=Cerrena zonata TaxID=2478898 RepID=A0AAW0G624_9APHY
MEALSQERVRRGICNIPQGSALVTDADEEVFLLYTDLAALASRTTPGKEFRGLGFEDSTKDVLTVTFEIKNTGSDLVSDEPPSVKGRRRGKKKKPSDQTQMIEIQLHQDKTALRSRKGDTGSVVWKASIELAQALLQQYHAKVPEALFDPVSLRDSHLLELGAGTGLLSVALSPLVQKYTVTDIEDLIPLIRKNIALNLPHSGALNPASDVNGPITMTGIIKSEPLDWLTLYNCSPSTRHKLFSYDPIDLLLVVDCIYHPSLLPALVQTIDHLATPNRTAVFVMVELRAEDVVREFLEIWLAVGGGGVWEIWHVNDFLEVPYAMWIGWKKS